MNERSHELDKRNQFSSLEQAQVKVLADDLRKKLERLKKDYEQYKSGDYDHSI